MWWNLYATLRRWKRGLLRWMRQPAVLIRWKVAVTGAVAMLLVTGLLYQTRTIDINRRIADRQALEQRLHDEQCQRAEARDDVRTVLFRITKLKDVFPDAGPSLDLYEHAMATIINEVLPALQVDDCDGAPPG